MRRVPVAPLLLLLVALLWPLAHRAASQPSPLRTFRVVTYNIHKGADRQGHYHLEWTIETIRRLNPDIVGLQEAMRNHPDFNCDDQPALIAEGLRRRTGRPWTQAFEKAWITDRKQCLERGRGNDVETEGLAILTPERIVASSAVRLSEGRVGLAVRLASMPDVPVVVTHLSANREAQPDREREIAKLLPWAARQGPGLLIGDLNAQPDASELQAVMARYRDSWAVAAADGRISGVTTGSTRPGRRVSRIDYVFYSSQARVTLESAEIIDTTTLPGLGEVSDHHPMVATFTRKPGN